jgi:hypothetical protein
VSKRDLLLGADYHDQLDPLLLGADSDVIDWPNGKNKSRMLTLRLLSWPVPLPMPKPVCHPALFSSCILQQAVNSTAHPAAVPSA